MKTPSGTASAAAIRKPPSTRHTVMPMSCRKPCFISSVQPDCTIITGSARKVLETSPPNVAAAHTAKNTMKKATPRTMRVVGWTGTSGFTGLLQEARVRELRHVGDLPDDADFQQQVGRFLAESGVLAGEELRIRL